MTIQFRELNGQAERTIWRTVDMGEKGSFEVELRRPRWGELAQDSERFAGYVEERMKTAVVGWRGVEQDGQPVPFSWESFAKFCEACPIVLQVVSMLVSQLYNGITEDTAKNYEAPSSAP